MIRKYPKCFSIRLIFYLPSCVTRLSHCLKVATQEVQLTSLSAEVETHARMENVTRREHFAAEHKKAEFLNEIKVKAVNTHRRVNSCTGTYGHVRNTRWRDAEESLKEKDWDIPWPSRNSVK